MVNNHLLKAMRRALGPAALMALACLSSVALSATDSLASEAGTGASPRLGTNLRSLDDWSSQRPFLNLFKQARLWLTQCDNAWDADCGGRWETHEEDQLDLDEQGWVRSLPAPEEPGYSIATALLALPPTVPAERYVVLYDGQGSLRYRLGASRIDAESTPGRDLLEIDVSRGPVQIQITATDPAGTGDYIRNLRLVREADEHLLASERFNPVFLERTAPYEALRFMEWMKINASPIARWEQRSLPEQASWSGPAGVPYEVLVELSNRLQKPAWLNIPHQADDDFVRRLAELVRDRLDPGLKVYVEYSNEVWNSAFSQQSWIREQAQALWPESSSSDFTKVINWFGKRSAEVCTIWKDTFGSEAGRVVCALGAQAANDWTARQALECPLWTNGKPCIEHGIDAVAIAPYFGGYLGKPEYASELEDWTYTSDGGLDLLFQELSFGGQLGGGPDGGGLLEAWRWIDRYASLAASNGLELLAYEAGQHLVGIRGVENNARITELFTGLNRDERMRVLYEQYLARWEDSGGGTLMHFSDIVTPGRYGSWGALEDVLQTQSPKYLALLDYLGAQAPGGPAAYTLTLSTSGSGDGTVSGGGSYAAGSLVSPTATAAEGSIFTGWVPTTCASAFNLEADTTCTAVFEGAQQLRVTNRGSSSDRVIGAGIDCGETCERSYATGAEISLTAVPASGSAFAGWSGDCSGSAECRLTMDGNKYVNADFQAQVQHRLYVRTYGTGTVLAEPAGGLCPDYCKYDYPAGTQVKLTVAPESAATFSGWSGACSGRGTCVVKMDAIKSVVASFR